MARATLLIFGSTPRPLLTYLGELSTHWDSAIPMAETLRRSLRHRRRGRYIGPRHFGGHVRRQLAVHLRGIEARYPAIVLRSLGLHLPATSTGSIGMSYHVNPGELGAVSRLAGPQRYEYFLNKVADFEELGAFAPTIAGQC
jgi:hypothetical protein